MQGQSVKSQVYEGLLKDILDGVYQANAILNEKTLMEKYNVSKTPVREALVQLCGEGVLNNIPRFGYQLSVITPSEIAEIVEFRKVIETGALEMCFDSLTEVELDQLKALNEEAVKITYEHDINTHWERNQDFHRKLCSFSENRYLQKSLEDSLKIFTRISNQYFTKLWKESKVSDGINHIRIVEAMEKKDLELAKKILSIDVASIKDEML